MLLNKYCIVGIIMVALAAWAFPVGLVVDVVIVLTWYYYRKMKAGQPQSGQDGAQTGSDGTSDLLKMMMITMLADKLPDGMKLVPPGADAQDGPGPHAPKKKSFFSKAENGVGEKKKKKVESSYKDDFL